jgi:hypothetical protein
MPWRKRRRLFESRDTRFPQDSVCPSVVGIAEHRLTGRRDSRRKGSRPDVATSVVSVVSNSLPYDIVAILFSLLLAHILG